MVILAYIRNGGAKVRIFLLILKLFAKVFSTFLLIGTFAFELVEDYLAQTQMVRSHFDILILLDILEGLFEREHYRGDDTGLIVGSAGTHIGKFLRLGDIDHNVVILGVLAYHLAGIDLFLRENKEASSILKLIDGISVCRAGLHCYERAIGATLDVALPRLIFMKAVGHDSLAGRSCEHIVAQTDDATRGYEKLQMYAVILGGHGDHLALATGHHIYYLGRIFLGDIDSEHLDRLTLLPVDLFDDNLRLTYLKFEALATHGLDKHRQVEHTATKHTPGVLIVGLDHSQSQIAVELLGKTVGDMARSDILAVTAKEGGVIDSERHRHSGLVDGYARQRLRIGELGHGVADLKIFETHKRTDVAALDTRHLLAAHTLEDMELFDTLLDGRPILLTKSYIHTLTQLAAVDTADGYTTHIAAEVERGDEHLSVTLDSLGLGYIFDNGIEHSGDVVGRLLPVGRHPAILGRTVYCREVKLILSSVKIEHEVKHHLLHLVGTAVGLIDLVDYHYRLESHLYSLLKHKTCLRHRALKGIDQQQATVGHVKHTLHLAAEVGVTRGVNDIDLVSFVVDRYVLGEDCDAALTLEVIIIEDKLAGGLIVAEELARQEHFVYKSSLSVVYVSDNCNVAYLLHLVKWILRGCKVTNFSSNGNSSAQVFPLNIYIQLTALLSFASGKAIPNFISVSRVSIHSVVGAEYLELGAAIDLVGNLAVFFRESEDILLVEHLSLGKLRVLA